MNCAAIVGRNGSGPTQPDRVSQPLPPAFSQAQAKAGSSLQVFATGLDRDAIDKAREGPRYEMAGAFQKALGQEQGLNTGQRKVSAKR